MGEFLCLDCNRSTTASDGACPRCGGKVIPLEGISKILDIIPHDDDSPPAAPLPPEVEAAAARPENLLDRYILIQVVGQGGMGRVYRAWHRGLQRYVALKIMSGISRFEREHFLREGRIAASLRHPHIVPVYDLGQTQNSANEMYFLCMEFINGVGIVRAKMARDDKLKALAAVARALDFCHQKGVIHRDIKPENILIDEHGTPFLTDFGLAKEVHTTGTRSSIVFGTPAYMAPEQARGGQQAADPRADIYALGATLYEILCGRPPFTGDQPYQIIEAALTQEPVAPGRLVAGLSRDLEIVCLKSLEKSPDQRYATALEFAEDLERAAAGEPIRARPPSLLERLRRQIKKHPAVPISVGVLAAFILGILLVQKSTQDSERQIRDHILRAGRLIDQFDAEYGEPQHDIRPAMSMLAEAISACAQAGPVPEALYEKGRAEIRLNALDDAIDTLSRSIDGAPETRYFLERGLAYLKIYQEQFDKLVQTQLVEDKQEYERVKRESWAWKDRALADLRRAAQDPQIGQARLEYAQALIDYSEGDMLPALRRVQKLQQALEGPDKRLRPEVYALEGDIHQTRGEYSSAEKAYAEALNIKRSHPEYARKVGLALLYRADSEELARTALGYFEIALSIDREYVPAIYGRGTARVELSRRLPSDLALLNDAIQDFSRVIAAAERYKDHALSQRALARAALAERTPGDPKELLESAAADMAQLAEKKISSPVLMNLGRILLIGARNEINQGRDPTAVLDLAIQKFGRAAGLGSVPRLHLSLGDARHLRARYLQLQGESPVSELTASIEEYQKEFAETPDSSDTLYNLSQAHFALAFHYVVVDKDAAKGAQALDQAIQSVGRSIDLGCPVSSALFERGKMHFLYGTLRQPNARQELDRSIEDFGKVASLDPRHAQAFLERGKAYISRAQLSESSVDRADLTEARRDIKAAFALDPSLADTINPLLGWLKSLLGEER